MKKIYPQDKVNQYIKEVKKEMMNAKQRDIQTGKDVLIGKQRK